MNKHLQNLLTVSATTLMMLGVSGLAAHIHSHAACTTAFNEVSSSPDIVASYVQKAENYDNNDSEFKSENDAQNFLSSNSSNNLLFNHYYLNPCEEQQYKVSTIGNLADYMNSEPDEYATDANKNNLSNSLNQNEVTIYNDELSHDGSQNSTHISGFSSSDNVPLTTNTNVLSNIKHLNKQINDAENYDNNDSEFKSENDAQNFLSNDSGNNSLFNHSFSDPTDEKEYQLSVIGNLADYMNSEPDEYATAANKNNIQQALTPDQLTIYNVRLGEDGAQLNTYINQSPYQFAYINDNDKSSATTSDTQNTQDTHESPRFTFYNSSNNSKKMTVTPHRHATKRYHKAIHYTRHAKYGYYSHGHYIKFRYGYFDKNGKWTKFRTGHFNKQGKWIRNHRAHKHYIAHKRHARRMTKRSHYRARRHGHRRARRY